MQLDFYFVKSEPSSSQKTAFFFSAKPSVAQVTQSSHVPHGHKSGMQFLISSYMSTLLMCLCVSFKQVTECDSAIRQLHR